MSVGLEILKNVEQHLAAVEGPTAVPAAKKLDALIMKNTSLNTI